MKFSSLNEHMLKLFHDLEEQEVLTSRIPNISHTVRESSLAKETLCSMPFSIIELRIDSENIGFTK